MPVALALTQGALETAAVVVALAVGAAYSLPPLRLKRYAGRRRRCASPACARRSSTSASRCTSPRASAAAATIPAAVWALTLFVLPFSFAIAMLKDVPDAEGDRALPDRDLHRAARRPARAARLGLGVLGLAYAGMAIARAARCSPTRSPSVLAGGHLRGALALLLAWARRADPDDPRAFTRFYMRVWVLFFLEYLLVPAAVLAG